MYAAAGKYQPHMMVRYYLHLLTPYDNSQMATMVDLRLGISRAKVLVSQRLTCHSIATKQHQKDIFRDLPSANDLRGDIEACKDCPFS